MEYLEILNRVELFDGISQQELGNLLKCLGAYRKKLKKGDFALRVGQPIKFVGIVLVGSLYITRESAHGQKTIISKLSIADTFAETLACSKANISPVSVIAETDATILYFAFGHILDFCSNACSHHSKLLENMLRIIAKKNILLQTRLDILSKKTIRERLYAYLESMEKAKGQAFSIPFNREELANFLCTDRSALSRELSRLDKEGALTYKKNRFKLLY